MKICLGYKLFRFIFVGTLYIQKVFNEFFTDWVVNSVFTDMFMGFEEIDGDDDIREEFPCPFCSEYFDIVGLCCHIDEEHPVEAKNGV